MNSKLLRIMAVGLATLFLSAQAFALEGAQGDRKSDQATSSMSNMGGSDQGLSTDRDMGNMDQGSYDNSKSPDQPETDQSDTSSQSDIDM